MGSVPPDTEGSVVIYRRRDVRTLEEHVDKWAARRMQAGVPARRCVLPFLTGAPKAVECHVCFRIIYAGEEIKCSISHCQEMFHLNCVVKDTSNFTSESFACPQHGCMVCEQKESFWRCVRCTVAAHTKCAPWPMINLKDDRAICWRHPSDWLLQNKKADLTNSIEEVFCRLPLPYVNEDINIDSTITDFVAAIYNPRPSMYISRNVYLTTKKHTGVHVGTWCANCRADSACKEGCECRALLTSCSKNCRCSDLCTNRPFLKDKKITFVKTKQGRWGVVALEPLEKGDFVIEYVGEVIDDATYEKRIWDIRKRGEKNFYMCEISKDFTIDVTFKGNHSRFLNHNCEPNCKLEKWQVDGEARVGVFASRSVKVGEALTYDFRTLRRHKDKSPPSFHPLDIICEAIGRSRQDASVGARAQHVASVSEEQNNKNSLRSSETNMNSLQNSVYLTKKKHTGVHVDTRDAVDPPKKTGRPEGWRPNNGTPSNNSFATPTTKDVYLTKKKHTSVHVDTRDAVDPPKKRGRPEGWRPNNGTPSNNSSATPSTKGKTASKDVSKTGSNLQNEVEKTSKDKGTTVASETTLRRHKDKSPPSKRKQGQETEELPRSRIKKGLDGSLVGARIKVWWPGEKMFYKGVVEAFDSGSKRHKVLYDDGDVEVLRLKYEKWDFISEEKGTSVASETTLRRHKDKSPPSFHPLDLICEAIGRSPQDVGARAQHVASVGEHNNMNSLQSSENNMNSLQKLVDFGGQGLDCELEQDLHDEPLNASANDADQQAQRSDGHVTKRPLTTSDGGILKKHKATAEMPCIQETGPVHPESRSPQANVNKQEATEGKDYSISRCLDVLEAMDDVPDEMKILASDVFRDATNREMFLCYAPRLRGPWLKKELEKLHGSQRVN